MKPHLISATGSLQNFSIIYFLQKFSNAVGTAILIYASVKYCFRLCLPFVAVAFVFSLLMNIANFTVPSEYIHVHENWQSIIILTTLYSSLYIIVRSLIIIGIMKVFLKILRNEYASISITILAMMVLNFLMLFPNTILNYYVNVQLLGNNMSSIDWNLTAYVSRITANRILSFLLSYLYVIAGYVIIRVLFSDNKRIKIYKFFSRAKTILKKLWEATSN